MGKRSRTRESSVYVRPNADLSWIARSTAPVRPFVVSLLPVEDLRRYHPLGAARSVKVVTGHAVQPLRVARPGRPPRVHPQNVPSGLAFAVPRKTVICIRRKRRREVLFAKNVRRGSGSRRRNFWSDIRC